MMSNIITPQLSCGANSLLEGVRQVHVQRPWISVLEVCVSVLIQRPTLVKTFCLRSTGRSYHNVHALLFQYPKEGRNKCRLAVPTAYLIIFDTARHLWGEQTASYIHMVCDSDIMTRNDASTVGWHVSTVMGMGCLYR